MYQVEAKGRKIKEQTSINLYKPKFALIRPHSTTHWDKRFHNCKQFSTLQEWIDFPLSITFRIVIQRTTSSPSLPPFLSLVSAVPPANTTLSNSLLSCQ